MGGQALNDAKREQYWNVDPSRPIIIGWDTEDGPEHPHWDERASWDVDEDMAMDMANQGVLQPVTVRKDGRGPDAPLLVVLGRQRVKAARRANEILKDLGQPPIKLPCIIVGSDDKQVVLMGLAENAHRQDNDPVTKARALQRAVQVNKIPIAEACQAMGGISVQTGQQWLKYFTLDKVCQKAVEDEKISFTAVVELADLPRDKQKDKLKELLESGEKPTVARARRAKVEGKKETGQKTKARETVCEVPSKRVLRKVVEKGKEYGLNDAGIAYVKWILGERDPSTIAGLSRLLKDIEK